MNKTKIVALAVASMLSVLAHADEGLDLAKQKQCLSCHSVDKTGLAPSFKDIAKTYQGKTNMEGALISQIMRGSPSNGGTHWGSMKMPAAGARPNVSVAEANKLLDWILSQK